MMNLKVTSSANVDTCFYWFGYPSLLSQGCTEPQDAAVFIRMAKKSHGALVIYCQETAVLQHNVNKSSLRLYTCAKVELKNKKGIQINVQSVMSELSYAPPLESFSCKSIQGVSGCKTAWREESRLHNKCCVGDT